MWDFGRTLHAYRASRRHAAVVGARAEEERAAILLEVETAFHGCLARSGAVRVLEAAAEERRLTLRHAQALAAARLRPELEASLAALRVEEAEVEAVRARHQVAECLVLLASAMGDEKPARKLRAPTDPVAAPERQDVLVERAEGRRPELRALRAEEAEAQEKLLVARSGHYPIFRVYASGGIARWNNALTDDSYFSAGAGLQLPLFAGYAVEADEQRARLERLRARARTHEERLRIRGEVAAACERLLGALELLRRYRTQVESAAALARGAREKYRAGLVPLLEVQAAEVARTSAELQALAAESEARLAQARLRYATGE